QQLHVERSVLLAVRGRLPSARSHAGGGRGFKMGMVGGLPPASAVRHRRQPGVPATVLTDRPLIVLRGRRGPGVSRHVADGLSKKAWAILRSFRLAAALLSSQRPRRPCRPLGPAHSYPLGPYVQAI